MTLKFIIFTILFSGFAFWVFRIFVRQDYIKKYKLSVFSYSQELIVFAIHAISINFFVSVKWPYLLSFTGNIFLFLLALILILIGFSILLVAWLRLGSKVSFGQDKNKLFSTGIYKYSRNPQIVGYGIILIVLSILIFSWYAFGRFIQYIIISYFMIISEEEFLILKYGDEYEEYCSSVPRLIKLSTWKV